MPLTRIDSAFLDLDAIGGIDFDVQSGVPTLKVDAVNHRVGIGENNPSSKLHITNVGDPNVIYKNSGNNSLDRNNTLSFRYSDGEGAFVKATRPSNGAASSTYLAFGAGGSTEQVRIAYDGKVGIGTDAPMSPLDILLDDGAGDPRVRFDQTQDDPFIELNRWTGTGTSYYGIRSRSRGANLIFEFADSSTTIGNHSYSEKFRINSNGNIGIGTDNPDTLLNLFGTGNATIKLHNNSATSGTFSRLQLITGGPGSSARSEIRSFRMSASSAATNLVFLTTSAGDTSATERVRIGSTGLVGIGTDDPQERLHVARIVMVTGATPQIRLNANDSDASDNDRTMLGQATGNSNFVTTAADNDTVLRGTSTGNLLFGIGTTEKVRIASDGDVGIGTNNPAEKLHVYATSGSDVKLKIQNTATNSYPTLRLTNDARTYDLQIDGATDSFRIWDSTASAQRFTVKSDGNVGVGTNNPTQKLSVYGGQIRNDITAAGTSLILNGGGANLQIRHTTGNIDFYNSGGAFSFSTATYSDVLKVASNGAVTVGSRTSTNPQGNLTIARGEAISGGTGPMVSIVHGPDSGTQRTHQIYSYIGDLRIVADSNENMELHTGGDLSQIITSTGNVGIGTNAPTRKLHIASTGTDSLVLVTGTTPQIRLNSSAADSVDANRAIFGLATANNHFFNTAVSGDACLRTTDGGNLIFGEGQSERFRMTSSGKIGIDSASPISKLQVGSHTFNGGHGMHTDDRVGISNHCGLTGLMLASIYNDATHPEYGLVFVQGPSTSNYNVWSISPQGPALGNKLEFIYGANATNIHTVDPKVVFSGDGNVGIGTSAPDSILHVRSTSNHVATF